MPKPTHLPTEIILHILSFIRHHSSSLLYNLILINKSFNTTLTPLLYSTINLDLSPLTKDLTTSIHTTTHQVLALCTTILLNPSFASHIHSLRLNQFASSIPRPSSRRQPPWLKALQSRRNRTTIRNRISDVFPRVNDSSVTSKPKYVTLLEPRRSKGVYVIPLIVLALAQLRNLRQLSLDDSWHGGKEPPEMWGMLEDVAKCVDSRQVKGTGLCFGSLEYLALQCRPAINRTPPGSPEPLAYFLGLPALKHLEGVGIGNHREAVASSDMMRFRDLRPGVSGVTTIELTQGCSLYAENLINLLGNCKGLQTFKMTVGTSDGHVSFNSDGVQQALLTQRQTLRHIVLDADYSTQGRPWKSRNTNVHALDFGQFTQLQTIELPTVLLFGASAEIFGHTVISDFEDRMPSSLRTLIIEGFWSTMRHPLTQLLLQKRTRFPDLTLIRWQRLGRPIFRNHASDYLEDILILASESGVTTEPVRVKDGLMQSLSSSDIAESAYCRRLRKFTGGTEGDNDQTGNKEWSLIDLEQVR